MTPTVGPASPVPREYRKSEGGGVLVVARAEQHDAVRSAVTGATLHEWAAAQPAATALQGRDVAWATTLPGGIPVVVRHARHGGLLAGFTGDLFLAPSRAPRELETALRLRASGVQTPEVIAYVTYHVFGPLCRADVATARIDGADLPAVWAQARDSGHRNAIVDAVGALLRTLQAAGAHHPDLNAKNVLISETGGGVRAWVLDVDRVTFGPPHDARAGSRNAQRLLRSLEKWRARHGLEIAPEYMRRLLDAAGVAAGGDADDPMVER